MLHKETVSPALLEVLTDLMVIKRLNSFRLVGGTAIALHLGHRKSVDIDLFSNEIIDKQIMAGALQEKFPGIECFISDESIVTRIGGIKIDIYDDRMIPFKEAPLEEGGIRLASLKDLAALKLTAFTERRDKKDYIDLFFLFEKMGGLFLLQEYAAYNPLLSAKSLLFALEEVTEAEKNDSPMPDMITTVRWDHVNASMVKAAKDYIRFLSSKR